MVELFINNVKVDGEFDVAINFSITDGWDKVKGAFSKTFTIPATDVNQSIFGYIEYLGSSQSRTFDAVIRVDGIDFVRGFARVDKAKINNVNYYEVVVFSGNKSWIKRLEGKTFRDLTFTNGDSFSASLFYSFRHAMTLIKFNNFRWHRYLDRSTGKTNIYYDWQNFRPSWQVAGVIDAIASYLNISINYPSLFNNLYIPHTQTFGWSNEDIQKRSVHYMKSTGSEQTLDSTGKIDVKIGGTLKDCKRIEFDTKIQDPSSLWTSTGTPAWYYTCPYSAWYFFKTEIYIKYKTSFFASDIEVKAYLYDETGTATENAKFLGTGTIKGGISDPEYQYVSIPINIERHLESAHKYSIVMEVNPYLEVQVTHSDLRITRKSNKYYYSEDIDWNDNAPDWSLTKFLSGLKHMFNLRFDYAAYDNSLTIAFEPNYYAGGDYKDITDLIDFGYEFEWYEQVKKITYSLIEEDGVKYQFSKLTYSVGDSGKNIVSENPFFAHCPMTTLNKQLIPFYQKDKTRGIVKNDYKPRLFYRDNTVTPVIKLRYYYADSVEGMHLSPEFSLYPFYSYYFENIPGTSDTTNHSMIFPTLSGYQSGLIDTYHNAKLQRLANGRKLKVRMRITTAWLNNMSFRDTFVISSPDFPEINGNYHLLEIRNYNPNKDGLTEVLLAQAYQLSDDITTTVEFTNDFTDSDDGIEYSNGETTSGSGGDKDLLYLEPTLGVGIQVQYISDTGDSENVKYQKTGISI